MANFPFVVQPRLKPIVEKIGSDAAGYIECKRQGYLSVGEKAGVRQIVQDYEATDDVIALSKKVATLVKVDLQEAYELVSSSITGMGSDPRAIEVGDVFKDEIAALTRKMAQAASFSELAKAFVLILYRVDGAEEVTMESVAELHPDLLLGLASLYDEEENKTVEKLMENGNGRDIEEVEEAGKK